MFYINNNGNLSTEFIDYNQCNKINISPINNENTNIESKNTIENNNCECKNVMEAVKTLNN